MSITTKLNPDGLVVIHCPKTECGAALRIKPKSAKTTVTCAKCGNKFQLEVAGMDAPAIPPLPAGGKKHDDSYSVRESDEPKRAAPPPKPKRAKQPWEIDDEEREYERRNREPEKKSAPVGLILGGVLAVVVLLGLGAVGIVYAMREKPENKPTTPVAKGPTTDRTVMNPFIPPVGDLPKADTKASDKSAPPITKLEFPDPTKEPETTPPTGKTDPDLTSPGPDAEEGPKGKTPKKKNPPGKAGPPVVAAGTVTDRVKKSTALIEAKGGWGTGFVIRPGIVMTNTHVIAGKLIDDLRVSFVSLDDTAPPPLKAVLLYTDSRRDLAILRVDTDRPPLEMTDPGTDLQGLEVAIVGNPKGDAGQAEINKVTTGRLNNPIRRDAGWTYYELTAQAYFGNSGGPVVDAKTGKLVGVVQSILGDGKQKSYCIPYGEAIRALDSLPAKKEDEPKATKIALARHYLDYIDENLPEMEKRAELAMAGQLNRLRAKQFGGDVTVSLSTPDGRVQTFSLAEFMDVLKEKHTATYPTFNKVMPLINGSGELPSTVKQFMRERIETYLNMYALANQSTKTEKAFLDAMDARKLANTKKAKEFKEAYDKFLDELERKPIAKPK